MINNSKKSTIKDVARYAGVSTATVERALSRTGRIKEETRQRVLDAIEVLNYQTNDVARALQNSRNFNMLAVYHREPEYFTIEFERGFKAAKNQLGSRGMNLKTIRPQSLVPMDAIKALEGIDYSNINAVMIDCGGSELDEIIQNVLSSGIPVATFGSDSPSSNRTFYIGEDPYISGQMAGDIALHATGGRGKYAVLQGPTSVYALNRRTEGFCSVLSEGCSDTVNVVTIDHDDNDALAQKQAYSLLTNGEMPDCIFCNSAAGAIALNRVMNDIALESDRIPVIIGYDLNDEIFNMLQRNRCYCTVYQNPYLEAYNVAYYMFEYLRTGKLPPVRDQYAYSHVVFKHNAKIYMDG